MRKHCFTLAATVLICVAAMAQKTSAINTEKGFLSVSAGPSFPLGEYGSTDITQKGPGFAKTGYNLNLHLGYFFTKNIGISASVFYTTHDFDNALFNGTGAAADHWQYAGAVAGVLASQPISSHMAVDLNVMTGAADVNSPRIVYNSQEVMNEAWAVAVPLKVDASLRYRLGERWHLIAGVNYMYMDPKFQITTTVTTGGDNGGNDGGEYFTATTSGATTITTTRTMHQVISAIGLHGGIGINF